MEDTNIKEWYESTFPTDELGSELNGKISFAHLSTALERKMDFYKFIGVTDSIVRERLFEKLAEVKNVDYDEIYYQWLKI